jgi:hypothetical protein
MTNIGNSPAKSIQLTDTLPNGTKIQRSVANLNPGTSSSERVLFTIPLSATPNTVFTNGANVSAKDLLGNPDDNPDNNNSTALTNRMQHIG